MPATGSEDRFSSNSALFSMHLVVTAGQLFTVKLPLASQSESSSTDNQTQAWKCEGSYGEQYRRNHIGRFDSRNITLILSLSSLLKVAMVPWET